MSGLVSQTLTCGPNTGVGVGVGVGVVLTLVEEQANGKIAERIIFLAQLAALRI